MVGRRKYNVVMQLKKRGKEIIFKTENKLLSARVLS